MCCWVTSKGHTWMTYLEIWEVFHHEAVDLADGQTSALTVHQRHEDQGAAATQRRG